MIRLSSKYSLGVVEAGTSREARQLASLYEDDSKGIRLGDTFVGSDEPTELVGGREPGLGLGASAAASAETVTLQQESRERRAPRHDLAGARVSAEEAAAHTAFLEKLKEPVWRRADDTES